MRWYTPAVPKTPGTSGKKVAIRRDVHPSGQTSKAFAPPKIRPVSSMRKPARKVIAYPRFREALEEMTLALNVGTAPEMPLGYRSPMAATGSRRSKKQRKKLKRSGLVT